MVKRPVVSRRARVMVTEDRDGGRPSNHQPLGLPPPLPPVRPLPPLRTDKSTPSSSSAATVFLMTTAA